MTAQKTPEQIAEKIVMNAINCGMVDFVHNHSREDMENIIAAAIREAEIRSVNKFIEATEMAARMKPKEFIQGDFVDFYNVSRSPKEQAASPELLKPCPFCGKTPVIDPTYDWVVCEGCCDSIEPEVWNRRAAHPAPPEHVTLGTQNESVSAKTPKPVSEEAIEAATKYYGRRPLITDRIRCDFVEGYRAAQAARAWPSEAECLKAAPPFGNIQSQWAACYAWLRARMGEK